MASVAIALAATAASAQNAGVKLPDYAKTPAELSATPATGGAGGSGNAKVEVVTILGDASKPGSIPSYSRSAPEHKSRRTIMPATVSGLCFRAPGTSDMAPNLTRPS